MEEIEALQAIYPTEFVLKSNEPIIKFELRFHNAIATFEIDPKFYLGNTPNI